MLRGTIGTCLCWGAAALAWSLCPASARAQMYAGPPAASFGAMGNGGGCASCGISLPTTCGTKCCQICCPKFHHCAEAPVRIHFGHACAKPVCNPCDLPHWGYYQKCWNPWPWPPDWGHCPTPPPAAHVQLNPATHYLPGPNVAPQRRNVEEEAPFPRQNGSGF
jgi:hypothetical protein